MTAPTPWPIAMHIHPGEIEVFANRGEHCDHRDGCTEPIAMATYYYYRRHGRTFISEHFVCLRHGREFADRHGVEVEPAPDESGFLQ